MKLTKKEENELWIIYVSELNELQKQGEEEWNKKVLSFKEWVEENYTRCESCDEIIGKYDFDVLETCDGYFCGSCRP